MRKFAAPLAGALLLPLCAGAAPLKPEEWPAYGHDYGDSRFSPLAQVTPANVAGLKPAWRERNYLKPKFAIDCKNLKNAICR